MNNKEDKSTLEQRQLETAVAGAIRPQKQQRTATERKMDRILSNRRSARRSRDRKKKLEESLETSVQCLSKQRQGLIEENNLLKKELLELIQYANQLNNNKHAVPFSGVVVDPLMQLQMAIASTNPAVLSAQSNSVINPARSTPAPINPLISFSDINNSQGGDNNLMMCIAQMLSNGCS
mmetsp:Transcript_22686/g.27826  ORF Transcript_22686/g.27826 Transcript_22686/m.27826 type:complete len:179 (+) Transcript_22686:98-634(+)